MPLFSLPSALFSLLRLGFATRFRLRGKYWQWRWQTAWGTGEPPTRSQKLHAILDYARWVSRMRKL